MKVGSFHQKISGKEKIKLLYIMKKIYIRRFLKSNYCSINVPVLQTKFIIFPQKRLRKVSYISLMIFLFKHTFKLSGRQSVRYIVTYFSISIHQRKIWYYYYLVQNIKSRMTFVTLIPVIQEPTKSIKSTFHRPLIGYSLDSDKRHESKSSAKIK